MNSAFQRWAAIVAIVAALTSVGYEVRGYKDQQSRLADQVAIAVGRLDAMDSRVAKDEGATATLSDAIRSLSRNIGLLACREDRRQCNLPQN